MVSKALVKFANRCVGALGLALMVAALGAPAFGGSVASTPEIDAGTFGAAITLLTGAVLVVTNRVRRKS